MKNILKKDKGTAGIIDHFPVIITIIIAGYLMLQGGYYVKNMEMVNCINGIMQRYALIMETTNGLDVPDMMNLYTELEELGILSENINLDGTTFSGEQVEYGDTIFLKASIIIPYYRIVLDEGLKIKSHMTQKEVNIVKCMAALG